MNRPIVADESVDFRIVTALRALGHAVYSVAEEVPSINDTAVLSISVDKKSLADNRR